MTTLQQLIRIQEGIDELIKTNQDKPKKERNPDFNILMNCKQWIGWSIQDIRHLY